MSKIIEIITINLWNNNLILKGAHGVNSYLIKTETRFIIIDTGFHSKRKELEMTLEKAGCKPGNLNLFIITHGDLDHIGNCAFLQNKFKAKIALHRSELESVVSTNMTLNRKKKPDFAAKLVLSFFGFISKAIRFHPNIFVNDGDNLLNYGLDAVVLHLPGHSKGSIGILTADGNLFCGDLLLNITKPSSTDLLDDSADLENSIKKLQNLSFHTIYPGHGKPFSREQFFELTDKRK